MPRTFKRENTSRGVWPKSTKSPPQKTILLPLNRHTPNKQNGTSSQTLFIHNPSTPAQPPPTVGWCFAPSIVHQIKTSIQQNSYLGVLGEFKGGWWWFIYSLKIRPAISPRGKLEILQIHGIFFGSKPWFLGAKRWEVIQTNEHVNLRGPACWGMMVGTIGRLFLGGTWHWGGGNS